MRGQCAEGFLLGHQVQHRFEDHHVNTGIRQRVEVASPFDYSTRPGFAFQRPSGAISHPWRHIWPMALHVQCGARLALDHTGNCWCQHGFAGMPA
jgi:hypothetical protein